MLYMLAEAAKRLETTNKFTSLDRTVSKINRHGVMVWLLISLGILFCYPMFILNFVSIKSRRTVC